MTKKRFRRGLAALGILAAFFLALMVLLFAPSLASAEKNSGPGNQHAEEAGGNSGGASNPIYSEHSWQEPEKVNWTAPLAGPCADQSCAGAGDNDDTQYFADGPGSSGGSSHSSNGPNGNGGAGGQGGQGDGSDAPHNGFTGGYGGVPGGPFGGGNPLNQFVPDHTGDGDSDKCDSDKADADKADADKGNSDKCNSDKDGSDKNDSDKDDSGKDDSGNGSSGNGGSGDHESGGLNIQFVAPPDGPYSLPPVDPQNFADPNPEIPPTDSTDDLPQQIPEPLTLSLFAVGLAGSVAMRRRVKVK